MSVIERIERLRRAPASEFQPTPGLAQTLVASNIEQMVEEIKEKYQTEVERDIVEKGKKSVITLKWQSDKQQKAYNQIRLSIRENSIGFMGNVTDNFYLKLEGNDIAPEKVEKYLAQTFVNPSTFPLQNTSGGAVGYSYKDAIRDHNWPCPLAD